MSNPSQTNAGWYDDGSGATRWWDGQRWTDQTRPALQPSAPKPARPTPPSYVVLQVILKEKMWGTGSGNLTELEGVINQQASEGYRLHTITTASSGSKGFGGGDRIQATMVFEKLV